MIPLTEIENIEVTPMVTPKTKNKLLVYGLICLLIVGTTVVVINKYTVDKIK